MNNSLPISRREALSTAAKCLVLTAPVVQQLARAQTPKKRLNPLIARLESGGTAITPDDWLFFDMEHGPYSMERLGTMLSDLDKRRLPDGRLSTAPIVRIPPDGDEDSRWVVKQVLDHGALGICFPHVESKAEGIRCISNMRYPPQKWQTHPEPVGKRGWAPGRAAKYWGMDTIEYLHRADVWPLNPDGELFALVQIESVEGARHVDEILETPGLGGILIGPSDLGVSLGVGPANPDPPPEDEELVQKILKACKAKNVACTYPVIAGQKEFDKRKAQGFRMLFGPKGTGLPAA